MTQTPAADIVERLRSWDHCYPGNINIERAISDAATEIEALRRKLDEAVKALDHYAGMSDSPLLPPGAVKFGDRAKAALASIRGETNQ